MTYLTPDLDGAGGSSFLSCFSERLRLTTTKATAAIINTAPTTEPIIAPRAALLNALEEDGVVVADTGKLEVAAQASKLT